MEAKDKEGEKREKGMRGARCGSRGRAGKEGKVHEGLIDGKKKGVRKKGRGGDQGRMGSRQEVNDRWRDRFIFKDEKRDEKRMRNWLPCGAILN